MKKITTIFIFAGILLFVACGTKEAPSTDGVRKTADADKMIYGLACDGCSDSVIVFMPFNLGDSLSYPDPISLNIVEAMRNKQVFGHPEIGDWVGVMMNPDNPKEATMVLDLDQLKGTWTYQVLPKLKQMATKSEKQIEAELTDSMREILFVPREYGFSLKRHHQAATVGFVYKGNDLQDESLVEYPAVQTFTSWYTHNGKLILVGDTLDAKRKRLPDQKVRRDTAEFVFMQEDSLVLRFPQQTISFHRQTNALEANKQAQAAAAKQAAKDSVR
jgi:hypothetical protein